MMIVSMAILGVNLTACDSKHDDTNHELTPKSETPVSFKPKPSVTVFLKEGWQFDIDKNAFLRNSHEPTDANSANANASLQEIPSQSLNEMLPTGTIVKHKTPILLDRDYSELLDSEHELLRYIVVIFNDPTDTEFIIDRLSYHPGIENVAIAPQVAPAEKSDQ